MEGTRAAGRQPFMLTAGDGWRESRARTARVERVSGLGGSEKRTGRGRCGISATWCAVRGGWLHTGNKSPARSAPGQIERSGEHHRSGIPNTAS